jgi:hypothetical protein
MLRQVFYHSATALGYMILADKVILFGLNEAADTKVTRYQQTLRLLVVVAMLKIGSMQFKVYLF